MSVERSGRVEGGAIISQCIISHKDVINNLFTKKKNTYHMLLPGEIKTICSVF